MRDQAHELRSLKMETALADSGAAGSRPKIVVITGGKGGVGISTLAVNLAASLARQGKRTLVASAAEHPGDMAMICGMSDFPTSNSVDQPIQGPAGLLMLPAHSGRTETGAVRTGRVLNSIAMLGNCADVAIVDAGNRFSIPDARTLIPTDTLLYVTTSDNVAVMDTYAAIKDFVQASHGEQKSGNAPLEGGEIDGLQDGSCESRQLPRLALLVNRCHQSNIARCAHDRISATCRRFLSTSIRFVGDVPDDSSLCTAQLASMPAVVQSPTSAAAKAISRVAAIVTRD